MLGAGEYESTKGVLFIVVSGQGGVFEPVPGGGRREGPAASGNRAASLVDVSCFDEPPSTDPVGAELSFFDECLGSAARHVECAGGFVQRQVLHGLNVLFLEYLIKTGIAPVEIDGLPGEAAGCEFAASGPVQVNDAALLSTRCVEEDARRLSTMLGPWCVGPLHG